MSRAWRYVLVAGGYVMLAVMTLVGLLLALTVYHAHSFRFHEGVLLCVGGTKPDGTSRIWGNPGAQTLGWLTIGASEDELARADLRVHEYVHVADALAFALAWLPLGIALWVWTGMPIAAGVLETVLGGGILFAITYGVFFLVPFALQGFKDWHRAYHKNLLEKHAYWVGDKAKGWGDKPLSRPAVAVV